MASTGHHGSSYRKGGAKGLAPTLDIITHGKMDGQKVEHHRGRKPLRSRKKAGRA